MISNVNTNYLYHSGHYVYLLFIQNESEFEMQVVFQYNLNYKE
jgi:hypothetical protein